MQRYVFEIYLPISFFANIDIRKTNENSHYLCEMNSIKLPISQKLQIFLGCGLFILLVWLYVLEFHWMQNTFEIKKLWLICSIFGMVIGFFSGKYFTKNKKDAIDKIRIFLMLIFAGAIIMPFFGSVVNRSLAFQSIENQTFEFLEQNAFAQERFGVLKDQEIKADGFYTFIIVNNLPFRIQSQKSLFPKAERGDLVEVPIKKGLLGFEVVHVR